MTPPAAVDPDPRPVLILQHQTQDFPAYLATWLGTTGIAFVLCNTEAGDAYPTSVDGHRALAVLGGEMSANDPLPSLRQAERLIADAFARDLPVIGHCLGGQLMARALGAPVTPASQPEVGWHEIDIAPIDTAREWFGDAPRRTVFQWHGERFALPTGAVALCRSAVCEVQAFAWGRHLAMQFHVEVDRRKLEAWAGCREPGYLAAMARHDTVHSGAQMLADAERRLGDQQALADRIYRRWLSLG